VAARHAGCSVDVLHLHGSDRGDELDHGPGR
jgi:hypothetical protein